MYRYRSGLSDILRRKNSSKLTEPRTVRDSVPGNTVPGTGRGRTAGSEAHWILNRFSSIDILSISCILINDV